MKRIIYIPFDHLHRKYGALREATPAEDVVVLVESKRMRTGRNWHPERLCFMTSAARHFAEALRGDGFTVEYVKAQTTIDGLGEIKNKYPESPMICAEPSSYRQYQALEEFGVNYIPNDFFLTPRELFKSWADSQKNFLMENFYRMQRVRLNLLMNGSDPVGGAWNFDKSNRLPPPKHYEGPAYPEFEMDEIDREVAAELDYSPTGAWATTREGALKQLNSFISQHLREFGPLEDAMTTQNWALHHSLLSPYINIGLLHPSEAVIAAQKAFDSGAIPIESAEAFIRQIIGWREYVNGMYWFFGEAYRDKNQLKADRRLLPLFNDPEKTSMNCLRETVRDIDARSWVHHIPRLMILSNLALLAGVNPQEFLEWMRERFIDASDWVMVPNVIGMGLHADSGQMMTKPYAAGGAYISRMSNYCKGCVYNPKHRTGSDACPFTTLYWDFLDRHEAEFKKNHRMAQQYFGLKKLNDLPAVKERAADILKGLETGAI